LDAISRHCDLISGSGGRQEGGGGQRKNSQRALRRSKSTVADLDRISRGVTGLNGGERRTSKKKCPASDEKDPLPF